MFTRHLANTLESVCDLGPERPALIHGAIRRSWGEFDDRAARLACALRAKGIDTGETIAIAMYNCPEWLETFYGAIKMRAVPANINYRYRDDEFLYLIHDSCAAAVVFHSNLAQYILRIRSMAPQVRLWIMVDNSDDAHCIDDVERYETLIANHAPDARIERAKADIYLSYTGGTTGLPRGVEYSLGLTAGIAPRFVNHIFGKSISFDADPVAIASLLHDEGTNLVALVAPPLMHSTGLAMTAIPTLAVGGTAVTMTKSSFDPHHTLEQIEQHRANRLTIVGDAFARPLLQALEERRPGGGVYHCECLRLITSSGAPWTASTKAIFFEYLPHVTLMESCGATEGVSYGIRVSGKGDELKTGSFEPVPGLLLVDEHLNPLSEQVSQTGLLASPSVASGYRNDPEKTAKHYKYINDTLYAVPGDLGRLESDGSLTLLGRGSSVVNTGGEKVHPEEVEDVIKQASGVSDCLVFGLPDERLGQSVTALVQTGAVMISADEIIHHVKKHLAGYKAPRAVVFVPSIPRTPSGKGDFESAKKIAANALSSNANY